MPRAEITSAPPGWEWKDVEGRIGAHVAPNCWGDFVYMGTKGGDVGLFKVLVPRGKPAVKKVDLEKLLSLQ